MKGKSLSADDVLATVKACMVAVFEDGASKAKAMVELDAEYDGWCIEITVRELTDEEKLT